AVSISTPVRPPLRRGQLVAPGYRVVAHLRRGNELDVYDVWSEPRLCRCIAKLPRPDLASARTRARVVREGELLLSLSHPHLVRAYELLREPQPTLLLETLGGAT